MIAETVTTIVDITSMTLDVTFTFKVMQSMITALMSMHAFAVDTIENVTAMHA